MIITRSPLRISIGGGGTDLASYYEKHTGFLVAAAIDKFVYITLHKTFREEIILKYSKMENVSDMNHIEHPIVRESFRLVGIDSANLELTSMADIPAGTGLGSSGSFTTALIKSLHILNRNLVHPQELAEQACKVEIDILKEPIGKQDQYIAAYGGISCFKFNPDGSVDAWPLAIDQSTQYSLEDNLLLFFTGFSRSASEILKHQNDSSKQNDMDMIDNLHYIKEKGYEVKEALESGNLLKFADLMNEHWERKKKRSTNMSNEKIDEWITIARDNGALGGKLVGAGGGGFLMFYAEDKMRLRRKMKEIGLHEVRFRFDFEGTKLVVQS